MNAILHRRRQGLTLIEILVVIAILGLVSAFLIPNLMDALQKAEQKRTLGTIRDIGFAWFSWVTDELSAAAAGSNQLDFDSLSEISAPDLEAILVPAQGAQYASSVPRWDSRGNPLDYVQATDIRSASQAIAVRSLGRDAIEEPTPAPYPMGPFAVTAYEEDIVWSDGFFVRYPSGTQVN